MSTYEFPLVVAEREGVQLTIDQRPPNGPEGLTVSIVSEKRGMLSDQNILVFHATFDPDEDINKTQLERNELKKELDEVRGREHDLRKEMGQLRARVKELEAELAKDRAEVRSGLAQKQIGALQAHVLDT